MQTKYATKRDEVLDFAVEIKKEVVSHNGFFKGYASTFGGDPDQGGDIIAKGCFTDTLKMNGRGGNGIAMLWSHDPRCPIGAWQLVREDEKGLYVEGMIEPTACPDGVPVHKVMKMGGIKGLSIGYNTVDSGDIMVGKTKARELKKVNLWEISLVTFPMNTRSTVTGVKHILEATTERELEDALREASIPRSVAKVIVKVAKEGLRDAARPRHSTNGEQALILKALRDVNAGLTLSAVQNSIRDNF